MSRDELLAEAMKLPSAERAELADTLLSSLEPDAEWEAAWVAESLRRADQWRAGDREALDWREATRRVRESLEKRP